MTEYPGMPRDVGEGLKRGLSRVEAEGNALLQQEQAEHEAREQALRKQFNDGLFRAEGAAIIPYQVIGREEQQLRRLFEELAPQIERASALWTEIQAHKQAVNAGLLPWYSRFDSHLVRRSLAKLRERAGAPEPDFLEGFTLGVRRVLAQLLQ